MYVIYGTGNKLNVGLNDYMWFIHFRITIHFASSNAIVILSCLIISTFIHSPATWKLINTRFRAKALCVMCAQCGEKKKKIVCHMWYNAIFWVWFLRQDVFGWKWQVNWIEEVALLQSSMLSILRSANHSRSHLVFYCIYNTIFRISRLLKFSENNFVKAIKGC